MSNQKLNINHSEKGRTFFITARELTERAVAGYGME
jgi:hypothetical protein